VTIGTIITLFVSDANDGANSLGRKFSASLLRKAGTPGKDNRVSQ